ncbi:bacteriocin immunity protein [Pseudomonas fluorescens]|uniref:bacteriocin immunity protein n=1 Tax=Pseudomonas fluorescens TaxID=294 RepID=UPI001241537A|nr:bacteriocin immunity protein [Pseudomonas fluorescens]VVN04809.1 hypothetical protein PS639_03477 [Pseudomonas fluorescens]
MELKATLKDYTVAEFLALLDKIWAVDLPKLDHDRLINHFDRIVGHPKGADLLFYPDNSFDSGAASGVDWVLHHVRDWHHKQGMAAFKGEVFPPAARPAPLSPVARNLAKLQKISTDVAVSEQALETAIGHFQRTINDQRGQKRLNANVAELETTIRSLERAQEETHTAVKKLGFWKMSVEFAMSDTQRDYNFARSDQAQWQIQVQQITGIQARYMAQLASTAQRYRALHDEAEVLLVAAQQQLVRSRTLAGVGPAQAAIAMTASVDFADKYPDVLLAGGPAKLWLSQQKDLQKSIRSAVAEFTWQHTAGESVEGHASAAVLHFEFSSRADTQVYGLSVPLAELVVSEGRDWQSLAANKAEVELPFRINTQVVPAKPGTMFKGLREVKTLSQVYINALQGAHPSGVRVRAARQEEQSGALSFTADGDAPITVSWLDQVALETDSSMAGKPNRLGFIYSSPVPRLEPPIDKENLRFDDYIVVFPIESGLDPLYVMFRDRREYPD